MRTKRAFTLLELMVVLSIIGILLGLVVTVASNMIQSSRDYKADALCKVVQQGLATYYAQKDQWPGSVGNRIKNDQSLSGNNEDGQGGRTDYNRYRLEASEVRDMIKEVVKESVEKGNPMMDIAALYVSRYPGEAGSREYGMDFMDAVRGTERSPRKMAVDEMYFGYPERSRGYFRRFVIVYSAESMEVTKQ